MSCMHPYCDDFALQRLIMEGTPGAQGERRLYKFFRDNMPKNWNVFYNQRVSAAQEHQIDFLVVVPGKGIVNIDAKGAGYYLRDGAIYLGNNPVDIYSTASGAIHGVDEYIRANVSNGAPWGAYEYLVVFTETASVVQDANSNHAFSILGFENNPAGMAQNLKNKIEALLDGHNEQQCYFNRYYQNIVARLCRDDQPFVDNMNYRNWDNLTEQMLTVPQRQIFANLNNYDYFHIKGAAGTGKTLIAIALAKRLANEGSRVLYVCYNKSLAESLRRRITDNNIRITSFYALGGAFGRQVRYENPFNRDNADRKLEEAFNNITNRERVDVLIVDEAQDLSNSNLYFLLRFLRATRKVFLFSDAEQTIFSYENNDGGWNYDEANLFQNNPVYSLRLEMNYRNTTPIHDRISQYEDNRTFAYIEGGLPVTEITRNKLQDTIEGLLARVSPSKIAILGYSNDALKVLPQRINRNGERNITFTDEVQRWESNNQNNNPILKTTVQSFKGLEADVVILLCFNVPYINEKLRYVAESRAKYELYLVTE